MRCSNPEMIPRWDGTRHRISGALPEPGLVLSIFITPGSLCDLVAGSGLRFEERGTHNLKAVPGSWQLLAAA